MRPTSDADRAALKAATRRAIMASGGPDSAAHITRVATAQLSRYGGLSYPDFIPLDVALDIDIDNGQAILATAFADRLDCRLVPMEGCAGKGITISDAVSLLEQGTIAFREIETGLHDGALTRNEKQDIATALDTLSVRISLLRRALEGSND